MDAQDGHAISGEAVSGHHLVVRQAGSLWQSETPQFHLIVLDRELDGCSILCRSQGLLSATLSWVLVT